MHGILLKDVLRGKLVKFQSELLVQPWNDFHMSALLQVYVDEESSVQQQGKEVCRCEARAFTIVEKD
jgi:hypothetical protein